jgi:amino acid transporter
VGTLLAGPDGATARGEIFPEQMSPFSIKAFSAFLFALAAAILSAVRSTDLAPFRALGWAGLYLIVPITGAALLNLSLFDASKPGTLVYLWAYIIVGAIIVAVLAYERLRPAAFEQAAFEPQALEPG